jgi:hypothetical protein
MALVCGNCGGDIAVPVVYEDAQGPLTDPCCVDCGEKVKLWDEGSRSTI